MWCYRAMLVGTAKAHNVTLPFINEGKGTQYQEVMTNVDITHCSYGMPYGPNCGGLYP